MSGNRIHTISSIVWIRGHDAARNKAWVASDKRISSSRCRRTNVQRSQRWRPRPRPTGPQQISGSNQSLARQRGCPKRVQQRRPHTHPDHPDRITGKLEPKWEGPFIVKSKASPSAYSLVTPSDEDLEHSWNIDNLRKFFV
jgi:hypothetical protein